MVFFTQVQILQLMRKRRSFSSSHAFSCYFTLSFIHIICCCIFLLLNTSITNANGFNPIIQLPTSELYRNSSCRSKTVVLDIRDFGVKGDEFVDATKSLQDAWKVACSLSSRVKIVIPDKTFYVVQPIDFTGPCKSKVTLKISGFINAPRDPEVWDGLNVRKWLYFQDVEHLTIEGNGFIDGLGRKWWARSCKTNASNPCMQAPTAMTFHKCNNLKVKNVTLSNSQQMHMAFTNCMHVVASGLKIIAPADSPNTDGIHISASKHVELKDTVIITGDDCISIVGNSSHIRIENIFCSDSHGISIGSLGKSNSSAAVHNVTVNRAFLFSTKSGLRIKTWQGGSGFVRNITFQNVWMHNVSKPVIIDQYYCDSSVPCLNQTSAVRIESVSFRGVKGTSATEEAIIFACSESHPCKRLFLEKIDLRPLSGSTIKSLCWEAYGTSSGPMYPPPCISSGEIIIQHNVKFNSTRWSDNNYAFF